VSRALREGAVRLRGGAGTGYRPPTFDDLFWPARASAAGNPDLGPEHSVDLDLGLDLAARGVTIGASAFLSRVTDLIQWVPGVDGVWRPHNVGVSRLLGIEIEAAATFSLEGAPAWIEVSYARLEAEDATQDPTTGGMQLVGRADHTLFGEATLAPGRWGLTAGARAVSAVPLTAAHTKWQEGYALVHARVRYEATPALRLEAEIRNAFDAAYEDVRGYPATGREVVLGVHVLPGGKTR
jgi:vitamin B12 transporter